MQAPVWSLLQSSDEHSATATDEDAAMVGLQYRIRPHWHFTFNPFSWHLNSCYCDSLGPWPAPQSTGKKYASTYGDILGWVCLRRKISRFPSASKKGLKSIQKALIYGSSVRFMYSNLFVTHLIGATLRDDADKISMAHDIRKTRIGCQDSIRLRP